MSTIGNAPSGEKTSSDGTEKLAISGSQWMLVSRIAEYIRTLTQTLTNKTLTTPTIADFTNAQHDHGDADDGGTIAESVITFTDITTNNASVTKHGYLPKLSGDSDTYLNGDGEFTTPTAGMVADTDVTFTDVTTNNASTLKHGFLPKLSGDSDTFLNGDGEFINVSAGTVADADVTFTDITTNNASTTKHGFLPKLSGDSDTFLNGDAEFETPARFTDYSATSTVVGWAATPTIIIFVIKIGRLVIVDYSITGASNATSTSFTVPYTPNATIASRLIPCYVLDNGSALAAPGRIRSGAGTSVITIDKTLNASNGWTASGTKTVVGSFSYITD